MATTDIIGRDDELRRALDVISDDGPSCVVITGGAGVGKTTLLHSISERAGDAWHVERVVAAAGVREIPFGAVAHLLPATTPDASAHLLVAIRHEVTRRAGGRPILVAVDDAHELDAGSAAAVHQLVVHGFARAVIAVRAGEIRPASIEALHQSGSSRLVGLTALGPQAARRLAERRIGSPITDQFAAEVWRTTFGHPLLIVLAVDFAIDAGRIRTHGGPAHLDGRLNTVPLRQFARIRLGSLPSDERAALATLSTFEMLPEQAVRRLSGGRVVDALLQRGLVRVSVPPANELELAHPLYGEVLREDLTDREVIALSGQLWRWVAERSTRDWEDLTLRIASRLTALDALDDPELALRAAGTALRRADFALAERIARAGLARGGGARLRLTLARALSGLQRAEEAVAELDDVASDEVDVLVDVALARSHALAFGSQRFAEATRTLIEARTTVPADLRPRLDVERALIHAMAGDFRAVLDAAGAVLEEPSSSSLVRVGAHVSLALAQAMLGLVEQCEATVQLGRPLVELHIDELPMASAQLELADLAAGTAAGRLDVVERACRDRAGLDGSQPHPLFAAWLAIVLDIRGDLAAASWAAQRSLGLLAAGDPFRQRSQVVGIATLAMAQTGAVSKDQRRLLQSAAGEAGDETRLRVWIERAVAWTELRHRPDVALRTLLAAGRSALEHDHLVWATWTLHDAVRWGRAVDVVDTLERTVAPASGARLDEVMLDHARALVDGDPDAMQRVARRFLALGSPKYAAEAWAQAATLARDRDDAPMWQRLSVCAAAAASRCSRLATPAIATCPAGLTERESDVAMAAMSGKPSRTIAEEQYVSVRTVDNHLRSVYRKLGISGRDELADVVQRLMGEATDDVPPDATAARTTGPGEDR